MDEASPSIAAAALYTGLLILMGLALQIRVIRLRRALLVGIGDGKDKSLALAIRVHGNFVENAAFGIGGLIMMALIGAPAAAVHGAGMLLLAGRIQEAAGVLPCGQPCPGCDGGGAGAALLRGVMAAVRGGACAATGCSLPHVVWMYDCYPRPDDPLCIVRGWGDRSGHPGVLRAV